jgi:glyoxylase-like metal-dependent hydrolase (beta-lactamase superfamily II)
VVEDDLTHVAATIQPTRRDCNRCHIANADLDSDSVVAAASIVIAPRVTRFRDTCNVYVVSSGDDAVLVDFGDGRVLDHLDELGVRRVTDVLLTHHHRDQLGGLARAAAEGIRIWAPPAEVELIAGMDERWRRRPTWNDYDLRQDRFSLLESVPVAGTVAEYRTREYGGVDVYTLPTPGHTLGSVTYLVELEGRRLAFTGDLVYGHGQVWSPAALQWTYSGIEGWVATVTSAAVLAGREPDVLLPSHGEPVDDPRGSLDALTRRVQALIDLRLATPWDASERVREPFEAITPHLLRNRTMFATNYVLLSETGAALLIDFGYDVATTATPTERTARRTLLWSLDTLRKDHDVERVDAALVTHYHDDHVAGLNLLRDVEGAEVWAPANVAPILERPERYDLPCLWFEPIPVDRTIPFEQPFRWHEHELTVYPLPGHTRYAAAIGFEADGRRILVTGDQQTDEPNGRSLLNFQYRNRGAPADFLASAELYRHLRPELVLGGHWLPFELTDARLRQLTEDAQRLVELHRELVPEESFGVEGFGARIEPYRAAPGETTFTVAVRNPFDRPETARVRLVVPDTWRVDPAERELELGPRGEAETSFVVVAAGPGVLAAELTVGETAFGQQAEAIVA